LDLLHSKNDPGGRLREAAASFRERGGRKKKRRAAPPKPASFRRASGVSLIFSTVSGTLVVRFSPKVSSYGRITAMLSEGWLSKGYRAVFDGWRIFKIYGSLGKGQG
jgi:hypothetical protein